MGRPPINPLLYVTVITRLPVHMHSFFVQLAAQAGVSRMRLYSYALRFAFQSETEFRAFVDAHRELKEGPKDDAFSLPPDTTATPVHVAQGLAINAYNDHGITPGSFRKNRSPKSDPRNRRKV